MARRHTPMNTDYLRSVIFGFEDALVSTTGVVVGITAGTNDKQFIILAGLVTVAVEALSMGAGQYLSEKAVHEAAKKKHKDNLIFGALLMFGAYSLGGMMPIIPVLLFDRPWSTILSITTALISLFLLGYIKASFVHIPKIRSGLEMAFLGGTAALIGVAVGLFLRIP